MEFEKCHDLYYSLMEAMRESSTRKALYERNSDFLELFESTLYDMYDVDSVYIVNDFFDKSVFSLDRLPLYWQMKQDKFEAFVDAREAEILSEQFDLYIDTNRGLFRFNNGFWKQENDKIIKKELWS